MYAYGVVRPEVVQSSLPKKNLGYVGGMCHTVYNYSDVYESQKLQKPSLKFIWLHCDTYTYGTVIEHNCYIHTQDVTIGETDR